jgi:hypothetical protein
MFSLLSRTNAAFVAAALFEKDIDADTVFPPVTMMWPVCPVPSPTCSVAGGTDVPPRVTLSVSVSSLR